jgi:putative glutamine amidotransferase
MTTNAPLIGITAHEKLVDDGVGVAVLHHVTHVAYVKAVRKAGGIPVLLPMSDPAAAAEAAARVDGILVTGGADVNPERYGAVPLPETDAADLARDDFEIALVNAVVDADQPLLCICRGIQILNVAFGGTLNQHHDGHFDVPNYNEGVHEVRVAPASRLASIVGPSVAVNSLHHQVVDVVAPTLRAVAHSDDDVIEGIEAADRAFVLGVQWHPELMRHRPEHLALFEALVEAANKRDRQV